MNREIKFRCWNVEEKIMHNPAFPSWNGSIEVWEDNIPQSRVIYLSHGPADEGILMQFTGLKDKNGVDVYEGDVVQVVRTGSNSNRVYTGVIEWRTEQAGWIVKCGKYVMEILSLAMEGDGIETRLSSAEVIGNIYQNPELLNL